MRLQILLKAIEPCQIQFSGSEQLSRARDEMRFHLTDRLPGLADPAVRDAGPLFNQTTLPTEPCDQIVGHDADALTADPQRHASSDTAQAANQPEPKEKPAQQGAAAF